MGALMRRLAGQLLGLIRRIVLALGRVNDPWEWEHERFVDPTRPTLQLLIAQQQERDALELGAMVCWAYSRDRVVEQRERRLRLPYFLERAKRDRQDAWRKTLNLVA